MNGLCTCLNKGGKCSSKIAAAGIVVHCQARWSVVLQNVVFHVLDEVLILVCDTALRNLKLVHDCQTIKPALATALSIAQSFATDLSDSWDNVRACSFSEFSEVQAINKP